MNETAVPFADRPQEIAALVNPAFGSLLINAAANGHSKATGQGIPFIGAFLILPTVLHLGTRVALPRTLRGKMHSWIAAHGELKIGFPVRARSMAPYTREAIAFGLSNRVLLLDDHGAIYGKTVSTKAAGWEPSDEPTQCLKKAEFLGRWLGESGDLSGVFAIWGIKP